MNYKSKKTGQSNTLKNWKAERKKRGIKAIPCICNKCMYYNSYKGTKLCKFGNVTKDRKKCIKFTTVVEYKRK